MDRAGELIVDETKTLDDYRKWLCEQAAGFKPGQRVQVFGQIQELIDDPTDFSSYGFQSNITALLPSYVTAHKVNIGIQATGTVVSSKDELVWISLDDALVHPSTGQQILAKGQLWPVSPHMLRIISDASDKS